MPTMPEIQKSKTLRTRYNAPDLAKLVARSSVTGNRYTCPICSAQIYGKMEYQQHLRAPHKAANKEPQG